MGRTASLVLTLMVFYCFKVEAQDQVDWLTFESLEDSMATDPKPVLLYFHTEWCGFCRKMDKRVFTRPEILTWMNDHFYAVRMDAESQDTIYFEGQAFTNPEDQQKGHKIYQIAQVFSRASVGFVAPTLVVLDPNFRVSSISFQYTDASALKKMLRETLPPYELARQP